MPDPATVSIRVAALLERPRYLSAQQAEDVYRAGETLALGLDIALAAGVKRTQLIAQRVNRLSFRESWTPPGDLDRWEAAIMHHEGLLSPDESGAARGTVGVQRQIADGTAPTRFPHLLGHAAAPWYYVPRSFARPLWLPEPQAQSHLTTGPVDLISVGSVNALAAELEILADFLTAHGLDPATYFPAALLEATAHSLETGLPIILSSEF
ncbi:MAG: hypothetical protein M3Z04_23700 [Chloroflexota bacterium]|nr:hypothetical protein [Chloroflexota bacterium]